MFNLISSVQQFRRLLCFLAHISASLFSGLGFPWCSHSSYCITFLGSILIRPLHPPSDSIMVSRLWVLSALCAVAFSAPPPLTYSSDAAAVPAEMKVLSDYFTMLATKVQAGRSMAQAPVCDMSKAVLPTTPGKRCTCIAFSLTNNNNEC